MFGVRFESFEFLGVGVHVGTYVVKASGEWRVTSFTIQHRI